MKLTLGREKENRQSAEHVFSNNEIECLKDAQKKLSE
jgi:hypothetical protein